MCQTNEKYLMQLLVHLTIYRDAMVFMYINSLLKLARIAQ